MFFGHPRMEVNRPAVRPPFAKPSMKSRSSDSGSDDRAEAFVAQARELGHRNVTTATAGTRADPPSARARSEQVKAMTEEQIAVFLPDARKLLGRDLTALFVLLAETGLRIGEALALRMGSACSSGRSSRRPSRFTAFVTPTRRSASLPARMSTTYPGSWGTLRRSSRWTPTHGGCPRVRRRPAPSRIEAVTKSYPKR